MRRSIEQPPILRCMTYEGPALGLIAAVHTRMQRMTFKSGQAGWNHVESNSWRQIA